jgi:hypothetical protein
MEQPPCGTMSQVSRARHSALGSPIATGRVGALADSPRALPVRRAAAEATPAPGRSVDARPHRERDVGRAALVQRHCGAAVQRCGPASQPGCDPATARAGAQGPGFYRLLLHSGTMGHVRTGRRTGRPLGGLRRQQHVAPRRLGRSRRCGSCFTERTSGPPPPGRAGACADRERVCYEIHRGG